MNYYKEIIEAIGQVGFPIAVATYLIIFLTKIFTRLIDKIEKIEKALEDIKEEPKKEMNLFQRILRGTPDFQAP
ncbi:MAG: hypothetical protein ACE5IH_06620 [Thermodesulfobacteriota bacterium]